nr:MAG TPA: hypothetical protein [Caudoviricetes sp.]
MLTQSVDIKNRLNPMFLLICQHCQQIKALEVKNKGIKKIGSKYVTPNNV